MAEAQQSLLKNSSSIETIKVSLNSFGKGLRQANSTSSSIIKTLYQGNRDKRSSILKQRELFQKRKDAVRKREREDAVEAGKITSLSSGYKKATKTIANSTKGFFGRALDFAGTIMIGWLVGNLPTIIKMSNDLMKRIQELINTLTSWSDSIGNFFNGFTSEVGAILGNLLGIDFNEDKKSVDDSIKQTDNSINRMLLDLEQMISKLIGFNLLTALGLKESDLYGDEQSSTRGGGSGTAGRSGKLLPIHREALDIIAGPESGGDYNAMNNGQAGDRPGGARKWLGKNLTDMTIGEVKDFQNNKQTLWAAGRYQIIPTSLPTAQQAAGLSDNDRFDEANQDLLAIGLLKVQGPGAWSKYSKYTKEQIAIMYKAKDTPLGQAAPQLNMGASYSKNQDVSSIVGAPAKITSIKGEMREGGPHGGIDIACDSGLYISLRDVDAEVVGTKTGPGYGLVIDVWVPSLGVQLRFAHNSQILIRSGKIPAGTSFAVTGSTGRSTGPHIHLEADTKRGSTRGGGNTSPNPYVALIRLTDVRIEGVTSQDIQGLDGKGGPTLERISKQTGVDKKVTPEKGPQTIPVPMPMGGGGAQQSAPAPQEGGGSTVSISVGGNQLNNFVIKTLLRELEYT